MSHEFERVTAGEEVATRYQGRVAELTAHLVLANAERQRLEDCLERQVATTRQHLHALDAARERVRHAESLLATMRTEHNAAVVEATELRGQLARAVATPGPIDERAPALLERMAAAEPNVDRARLYRVLATRLRVELRDDGTAPARSPEERSNDDGVG